MLNLAPPEVILGQEYNGLKVDLWSSAIILYAMLTG
jgi:serine/threonine protein kinase